MMNRAQRRAAEKQTHTKVRRPPTYNVTQPQLHRMVHQEIDRDLKVTRQEIMDEAINQAMILLLTLPLEVLMNYYVQPEDYRTLIPEFTNYVLQYYEDWQDGKLDMDKLKEDLWEYGGVRLEEGEREVEETDGTGV